MRAEKLANKDILTSLLDIKTRQSRYPYEAEIETQSAEIKHFGRVEAWRGVKAELIVAINSSVEYCKCSAFVNILGRPDVSFIIASWSEAISAAGKNVHRI